MNYKINSFWGARIQRRFFFLSPIIYPILRLWCEVFPKRCPECKRGLSPTFWLYYCWGSRCVDGLFRKVSKKEYPGIGVLNEEAYCLDCFNNLYNKNENTSDRSG